MDTVMLYSRFPVNRTEETPNRSELAHSSTGKTYLLFCDLKSDSGFPQSFRISVKHITDKLNKDHCEYMLHFMEKREEHPMVLIWKIKHLDNAIHKLTAWVKVPVYYVTLVRSVKFAVRSGPRPRRSCQHVFGTKRTFIWDCICSSRSQAWPTISMCP